MISKLLIIIITLVKLLEDPLLVGWDEIHPDLSAENKPNQ